MSTPDNHLGGKCPCVPFFIGGQMSEGGNVLHSSRTDYCVTIIACFYVFLYGIQFNISFIGKVSFNTL